MKEAKLRLKEAKRLFSFALTLRYGKKVKRVHAPFKPADRALLKFAKKELRRAETAYRIAQKL